MRGDKRENGTTYMQRATFDEREASKRCAMKIVEEVDDSFCATCAPLKGKASVHFCFHKVLGTYSPHVHIGKGLDGVG